MKAEGTLEIDTKDAITMKVIGLVVFVVKVAATLWLTQVFGVIEALR